MNLSQYQTFVFDCDGVILDSNKVKTQAFYDVALSFGHENAKALVDYHVINGGISRYLKFKHFIEKILQQPITQTLLDELLKQFSLKVKAGLMQSDIAQGLSLLRKQTLSSNWLVVSGGDQRELHEIFIKRGLFELFDGGIFGSPDTKDIILKREKNNFNIHKKALFLGDSKYDFQAADRAGLDFVFLTGWTEVKDWKAYQKTHGFCAFKSLNDLV